MKLPLQQQVNHRGYLGQLENVIACESFFNMQIRDPFGSDCARECDL
jgi:hypothetical protein